MIEKFPLLLLLVVNDAESQLVTNNVMVARSPSLLIIMLWYLCRPPDLDLSRVIVTRCEVCCNLYPSSVTIMLLIADLLSPVCQSACLRHVHVVITSWPTLKITHALHYF